MGDRIVRRSGTLELPVVARPGEIRFAGGRPDRARDITGHYGPRPSGIQRALVSHSLPPGGIFSSLARFYSSPCFLALPHVFPPITKA